MMYVDRESSKIIFYFAMQWKAKWLAHVVDIFLANAQLKQYKVILLGLEQVPLFDEEIDSGTKLEKLCNWLKLQMIQNELT